MTDHHPVLVSDTSGDMINSNPRRNIGFKGYRTQCLCLSSADSSTRENVRRGTTDKSLVIPVYWDLLNEVLHALYETEKLLPFVSHHTERYEGQNDQLDLYIQ